MALIEDYSTLLGSFRSKKFKKLRPAQSHILDQYSTFEPKPDVAIELPTGAGKTLIALLIAEAWRKNGNKIAILSANKTLARQMQQEAEALKIPSVLTDIEDGHSVSFQIAHISVRHSSCFGVKRQSPCASGGVRSSPSWADRPADLSTSSSLMS